MFIYLKRKYYSWQNLFTDTKVESYVFEALRIHMITSLNKDSLYAEMIFWSLFAVQNKQKFSDVQT